MNIEYRVLNMKNGLVASLLACLALAGCSRHMASTTSAHSQYKIDHDSVIAVGHGDKAEPGIVGKWKGSIEMPKSDDPAAKMAEAMASMFTSSITLEFKDDEHFSLSMMGMPMEGTYEMDGNNLTLTPKTFMGMTEEELKKTSKNNSTKADFSKPMEGKINASQTEITIVGDKASDGNMVFKRAEPEKPKEVSKPTVKGMETQLVGSYSVDVNKIDVSKLKPSEKDSWPMMKSMLESSKLVLSADNTFRLNMIVEMEGSWIATGGKLTLTPTKVMGMGASQNGNKGEILDLWVRDDGMTLESMPRASGGPELVFSRDE